MKQVEEESVKVGLSREDALCRSKLLFGVKQIATRLRSTWPHSLVGGTTNFGHSHLLGLLPHFK